MSDEQPRRAQHDVSMEERGSLADAAVTVITSGVGSAVGTYVGAKLLGSQSEPPPPPPTIELPPGVSRD